MASEIFSLNLIQPFHQSQDAEIFHVNLKPDPVNEANAQAWLDEPEIERFNRFVHPRPQREFCLCRAALRAILCSQLECDNKDLKFRTLKHGKPFALVNGKLVHIKFNVSHSGQHGLVAILEKRRIGVDVEEHSTRRRIDGEILSVFSKSEQADLARVFGEEKVDLFYSLWTMKEALIKALGIGFYLDPSHFEIPLALRRGSNSSTFRFPQLPSVKWRLKKMNGSGLSAAIAYEMVSNLR